MPTVTERIESLKTELQAAVVQYNKNIEEQAVLREQIIATQGALNALQEFANALQEFAKDETLNRLKEVEE